MSVFTVFDKDGGGSISMKEFEYYLPSSRWEDVILEIVADDRKDTVEE